MAVLVAGAGTLSRADEAAMPKLIEKNGRHALLVDGRPFFMLGGQAHNSSAWPGMLPQVWDAIEDMHANTLGGANKGKPSWFQASRIRSRPPECDP